VKFIYGWFTGSTGDVGRAERGKALPGGSVL